MNLTVPHRPQFGSRFIGHIDNCGRTPGNRAGITDAVVKTVVDEISKQCGGQEVISRRIDPKKVSQGYAYEIPGVLFAFSNAYGFDVVCLDKHDEVVLERLQEECQSEVRLNQLFGTPITMGLDQLKIDEAPVNTTAVLNANAAEVRATHYPGP